MKRTDRTARGFGVIVSALCASFASGLYTVGIVAGCRATACDNSRPTVMSFSLLVPLGALIAGPIVAVAVARTSASGLWLAVASCALALAAVGLGIRLAIAVDAGEDFAFAVATGYTLAIFLAPVAGLVTAMGFKKRVGASPPGPP